MMKYLKLNYLKIGRITLSQFYICVCITVQSCTTSPELFLIRSYLGIPGTENIIQSEKKRDDESRSFSIETNEIPKNIIFVIADGLGIGQLTLMYYNTPNFAPADFTHVGLMTVHPSPPRKVSDSANTATSMATGVKTHRGGIGVNENDEPVKTVLEYAEEKGMLTGLTATSSIAHATPASFAAHIDKRSKYEEIALQMAQSDVDVMLGGGIVHFDGEPQKYFSNKGGKIIYNLNSETDYSLPLLGLFADKHLKSAEEDREVETIEMAKLAIHLLSKNPEGFFLMIEESQVDFAGHANNSEYMSAELQSLNTVLRYCLEFQKKNPDTLVLFTADHETGGMAVEDTKEGDLDIQFTTGHHTANMIPVFAIGPGAEAFSGVYDNTDIGKQLIYFIQQHK